MDNANILYRRMTKADIPAVHAIETATFPDPWSLRSFESELQNPCTRYLVAVMGEEVVGFAGIWIILDEGHVTNVAIQAQVRGNGIGRKLTTEMMQYASNLGVRYVTLEVRASNIVAQTLYKSLGFHKVSIRKKYYEDNGEDAWLMVNDRMPSVQDDFTEEETVYE